MIEFRPYQLDLINKLVQAIEAGYRRPLLVLPMSGGKTLIMAGLLARLSMLYGETNNLALSPFKELRDQTAIKFLEMNAEASCMTYQAALASLPSLSETCILLLDEAHHIMGEEWRKIPQTLNPFLVCGFTATPYRVDSCPLLAANGGIFDCLIMGPTIEELVDQKFIANHEYYSYPLIKQIEEIPILFNYEVIDTIKKIKYVSDDKTEDIIEEYGSKFNGMAGIVFCKNVEHASLISNQLNSAGIKSASINCYRPKKNTKQILDNFRKGEITLLTACNMASEGLDIPHAKLGIMARKISVSVTLFCQQVGRFLRLHNNETAKILDLVSNWHRFGTIEESMKRVII